MTSQTSRIQPHRTLTGSWTLNRPLMLSSVLLAASMLVWIDCVRSHRSDLWITRPLTADRLWRRPCPERLPQ